MTWLTVLYITHILLWILVIGLAVSVLQIARPIAFAPNPVSDGPHHRNQEGGRAHLIHHPGVIVGRYCYAAHLSQGLAAQDSLSRRTSPTSAGTWGIILA